jgi:hypothetical protein
MCFMSSPKAPPPPPPPPSAPPVLEQDVPKLSDADEDASGLSARSKGFKAYRINKRDQYTSDSNKLGGMATGGTPTY